MPRMRWISRNKCRWNTRGNQIKPNSSSWICCFNQKRMTTMFDFSVYICILSLPTKIPYEKFIPHDHLLRNVFHGCSELSKRLKKNCKMEVGKLHSGGQVSLNFRDLMSWMHDWIGKFTFYADNWRFLIEEN